MLEFLTKLVDADKIGGWVRAAVAAFAPWVIIKIPFLSTILTTETLNGIAAALSAVIVGIWSTIAKNKAAA